MHCYLLRIREAGDILGGRAENRGIQIDSSHTATKRTWLDSDAKRAAVANANWVLAVENERVGCRTLPSFSFWARNTSPRAMGQAKNNIDQTAMSAV